MLHFSDDVLWLVHMFICCDVNTAAGTHERMQKYSVCQFLPFTIRYDTVYVTCSIELTGSQLSLLHEVN